MKRPYIIALNSVSGGGKTALAKLLHESLRNSALFCFADFDETNVYPEDFYEWWKRGADLREFDCIGMREKVDEEIHRGSCDFIILDYPFGREHPRFEDLLDLSVFVDTPLDVAMARRIIRDFRVTDKDNAEALLERLRGEMVHYLEKARYPYLDTDRHKPESDLVLSGWRSLNELKDEILRHIQEQQKL